MTDWKIVGGPQAGPDPRIPSADVQAWTWDIERFSVRRKLTILMSGTLFASTRHPSDDAATARQTQGRNYAEAVLHLDDPPRYRTANTERTLTDNLIDQWEIRVHAIHNQLRETVYYPTTGERTIEIPPGETARGLWFVRYDKAEHPEMANVAEDNEIWFTDSPDRFHWGSITFPDPKPIAAVNMAPLPTEPPKPRFGVAELSAVFEAEYRAIER